MKFQITASLFFLFIALLPAFGQKTLEFQVFDQEKNQLEGASIAFGEQIVITDKFGRANALSTDGVAIYRVSYIGYETIQDTVDQRGTLITVIMKESEELMKEVIVAADDFKSVMNESSSGHQVFSVDAISNLPYLLGEQDPIKYLQTQSGVSTGTDGNNGYYVRGGGVDQNKISLDHIELYNSNHLFGFFSMFSTEAIDRVDYYKSGYPASVGGRLSSSLEIHTRTPQKDEFSGNIGLGLLSAKATLDIPIVKEKSGLMVSFRRSYFDLITQNLLRDDSELKQRTDYHFSDYIIKYDHQIGKKHFISLTGFGGQDAYQFRSNKLFSNDIFWQSHNAGLSWKWLMNDHTDMEVFANTGAYHQRFGGEVNIYKLDLRSDISNAMAGVRLNHQSGSHVWGFGLESTYRAIKPNQAILTLNEEEYKLADSDEIPSLESVVFVDDEFRVSDQWVFGAGLRLSTYSQLGPFNRYPSDDELVITDTLSFAKNERVKTYWNLEPRVRLNYLMDSRRSIKFSYDRSNQYIHLSPLSSVSLPTDIWVPSSSIIKPQFANQWTLGYLQVLDWQEMKLASSLYFKTLGNQVEYENGAVVGYSPSNNYDDVFIFGKGRSYGWEFSAVRESGAFQYQINYTLSKTERKFAGVSGGNYFPAKYDRTHDLNLVGTYTRGNWAFSGLFKLSSGNALTLPTAKYLVNGNVISEYAQRNAFRMPVYHRMDLAAALTTGKRGNQKWVFSVYNVYNRSNPYYVYFDVKGAPDKYELNIDLKKVALFPVLPSVSYEWNF